MTVKSESEVAQSCPTLSDPMDCSPPGSSIHGVFQAKVLEWGAIAFSSFLQRFINTIFSRFHKYVLIYDNYFSLFDSLCSIKQVLGSSTSLELTQIRSVLWLIALGLCCCT